VLRRQRVLIIALAALAAAGFLGLEPLLATLQESPGATSSPSTTAASPRADPTAAASDTPPGAPARADVVSYAVALEDLPGLSPDAPPGTRMQLWVAWEPPIVRRPRLDLLLRGVILEKVVPPLSPRGRGTALLLLRPADVPDLLYADRWGSLSAVAEGGGGAP
jgi:hypothetical protein